MKSKTIVPLVVGLAVGVVAIKYTMDAVKKAKGSTQETDLVTVVIARTDIPSGEYTAAEHLVLKQVQASPMVPRDSFRKIEKLVKRVTKKSIPAGVPVAESMLAPPGTNPGIEGRLKAGQRAVSVKIDESSGVAYLVKPNDWVDVLAVMDVRRNGKTETNSRVVLRRVQVGAVGQAQNDSAEKGPHRRAQTVTLIVKKQDVPKLHLAQTRGRITLAMRGADDDDSFDPEPTNTEGQEGVANKLLAAWMNSAATDVQPIKAPAATPKPKPEPDFSVTSIVINSSSGKNKTGGGDVQRLTFTDDESMDLIPPRAKSKVIARTSPEPALRQEGKDKGESEKIQENRKESDRTDSNEVTE